MSNRQWPEIALAINAILNIEERLDAKQDTIDGLFDKVDSLQEVIKGLVQDNANLIAEIETLEDSMGANAGVKS